MYKNSTQRFREIVKILGSYGFGFLIDSKLNNEKNSPENLRKAFEELGPTFIKIGQILSTRPDLLPDPYIDELSKLQDSAPPETFEEINNVFFSEFRKSISDMFLSFDRKPLACASISQVHKAVLKDGREVVVKIQRPEISEKMSMDINILYKIFKLTKAKFLDAVINPIEVLDELWSSTQLELDFLNEENNITRFKELNKDVAFVYCPELISELSSSKVLTMEHIDGFKINNFDKLNEGGYDLNDVGKKLALSYFKQIFEDGFFHGDPHPGNLLIREGKICYLDFGIMGNLSAALRSALNEAIIGVANSDASKIVSVLMSIGIKKGYVNRNKLYEDIDYLLASYLSTSLKDIQMSVMLQEIFEAAKQNNIRFPKDFTILIRGLVVIEGVISYIAPDIRIIDIAIPYVKANNKFSILHDLSFDEILFRTINFTRDTARIPTKFIELSDSILTGRAKVQLQLTNLNDPISELNKMINRIVFGVVVSALIMGSAMILSANIGPKVYGISILGIGGFGVAAIMALRLLISILKSGKM